jgi:hypothetical protein
MHTATVYIQERSQHEQIVHWRQELSRLSQPRTYRERVLINVYRQLIHSRGGDSGQLHQETLL